MSKMVAGTVKHCCCCINLRTGCLVIGWLTLIGAVGGIYFNIRQYCTYNDPKFIDEMIENDPGHKNVILESVQTMKVVSIITVVYQLVNFINSIMLLSGVYQHKRVLVKLNFIISAVMLTLAIIAMITCAVIVGELEIMVVAVLIFFALPIYFVLVIRSYYYQMKV